MRTMLLNGKLFQVITPRKPQNDNILRLAKGAGKDIYSVYTRPSRSKIDAYNEWKDWSIKTSDLYDISQFGITGAGSHFFSIGFMLTLDGKKYIGKITRDNQTLTLAEEV